MMTIRAMITITVMNEFRLWRRRVRSCIVLSMVWSSNMRPEVDPLGQISFRSRSRKPLRRRARPPPDLTHHQVPTRLHCPLNPAHPSAVDETATYLHPPWRHVSAKSAHLSPRRGAN